MTGIRTALAVAFVCSALLGPDSTRAVEPAGGVSQASGLKAFCRSGQTFITWQETGDSTVRYRIYRSSAPITDLSALGADQQVAEVSAGTSLNLSASIDINEINHAQRQNRNYEYEIPKRYYYVIDEKAGPLSPTTGLFVYTDKKDEPAYYAVTAVKDGVEVTSLGPGNAPSEPIEERVAFPGAVVQRRSDRYTDYVHWTDDVGTEFYPSMGSLPSTPYNFRLFVPKVPPPYAVILTLHGSAMAYWRNQWPGAFDGSETLVFALDSPTMPRGIKDAPNNPYPFRQGWYGHNSNAGTGRPESEGELKPYVANRVVWMIDWAAHNFQIDITRVGLRGSSMGSIGTFQIGMMYPEKFAVLNPMAPIIGRIGRGRGAAATRPTAANGPEGAARGARGAAGRGGAREARPSGFASMFGGSAARDPVTWITKHPEIEFPPILLTVGRTDNVTGWKPKIPFVHNLEKLHSGCILYWDLRSHFGIRFDGTPPEGLASPVVWNFGGAKVPRPTMPLNSFATNQSYLAVANLTANDDPGTVDFAVPLNRRPAWDTPGHGDYIGTLNGALTWDRDSLVDTADRYEVTMRLLDFSKKDKATATITPRRVQNFHSAAGSVVHYSVSSLSDSAQLASGEVKADEYGHVTVEKVPVSKAGTCLTLRK